MINDKKVLVVIPARMGSYRFPTKPLELINGIPMIQRVYQGAMLSKYADFICIATPNEEISKFCESIDANYFLTKTECKRGTNRVFETYQEVMPDADIIVNLQGDEPLVNGEVLDLAIKSLYENPEAACVNLFKYSSYQEALEDMNEVKVVTDCNDYAMYFSRNPLPAIWLGDKEFQCKLEICIMPFWDWSLTKFEELPERVYEDIESVDMLRLLENGLKVKMVEAPIVMQSVDVPEDILKVEKILNSIQ